jgi:hypothetical protein
MNDNIHTTDAKPGEVLASLTHTRGNDGSHTVRLSVQDMVSGQRLVSLELTPEIFAELMSGTSVRVPGAALPSHPHRLGKRMQNTAMSIGHKDGTSPEEVKAAFEAEGWEQVRIDRTNFGHRVVAYRWVEDQVEQAE